MLTNKTYYTCLLLLVAIIVGCQNHSNNDVKNQYGLINTPDYYNPHTYQIKLINTPIKIDGIIKDNEWDKVQWSSNLVSEVTNESSSGTYACKFKLATTKDSLYFAAIVFDDHIWSAIDICESYFFDDNFIELAIDCDNDEFDYTVFKFNALGNFCGEYWNRGMKKAESKFSLIDNQEARCKVFVNGTVNNPNDVDEFWSVEAAIPLSLVIDDNKLLAPNSFWKINVCRTRWTSIIVSGIYKKIINSQTGKKYLGEKWIWNPMDGYPLKNVELWGECYFYSGKSYDEWLIPHHKKREIKWELRNIYYAQHIHYSKHNRYTRKVAGLKDVGLDMSALNYKPDIRTRDKGFAVEIKDPGTQKKWRIDHMGRITWGEE